ncbi:porin [Oricola cellulosilytica]|uniref:Porin n=1 Tax=Oricola cellulosilytica TaxID=1429082 RepID=A0A4R0PAE9_9HYPH|nr:porin [Oricola cellulosilytica]TCD14222.1 porin [Oricola cellulosilytica]
MKLKSLLLGSAAALVAVSGARAADAVIIPEPEVVEYVRVCDAYGTGYFYIPGTETCLRVHGYVRYDMGFGELNGAVSNSGDETWRKRARASFRVSTAAETDYGTLRTYVETRWQFDTNGATPYAVANGAAPGYTNAGEFSINFAYIDLNGFRVGKDESYFTTFTGYAGSVINDTTGGGYGPFDTNLISYTWSSGAFTAGISLEEGVNSTMVGLAPSGWGIDDYVPHVVVGLGYDAGIVNLRGVFGYDTRDDFVAPATVQGGWAAKVRGDVDITDAISAFVMVMYGENSSGYTSWATGAATDKTWSVIGGASLALTDAATFNTQVQWAEANGGVQDVWAVAANVNYQIAPGFDFRPEVQWAQFNDGTDGWGGVVRFQRSY